MAPYFIAMATDNGWLYIVISCHPSHNEYADNDI